MIKNWILAARPKTLFVSVAPVILGASFAFFYGSFKWLPALICLVFALLAQITSNLINDYFDYKKGADTEERLGPARMCASGLIKPKAMLRASMFTMSLALLLGLSLLYWGGVELMFVGAVVAIFAFAYSGGPYPLAYKGWGDVAVLVFYGIVPVYFTYYVQRPVFELDVLLGSIAVGLLGMNLLIVNNYRDYFQDKEVGKMTTVVRFGRPAMSNVYLINILVAFAIGSWVVGMQTTVWWYAVIVFLVYSLKLWRSLITNEGKALNKVLGMTSFNVLIYALLVSVCLIIVRLI